VMASRPLNNAFVDQPTVQINYSVCLCALIDGFWLGLGQLQKRDVIRETGLVLSSMRCGPSNREKV
jgi:hypothetical protein